MKELPNYWSKKVAGSEVTFLYNDTYNTNLMVVFNATDKSLAEIAARYDMANMQNFTMEDANGQCFWNSRTGGCVIAIKPLRPTEMFMCLAHELVHWIDFLYHDRGMNHASNHDEATAYLVGWANRYIYSTAANAAHAWNLKNHKKL